MKSMIFTLGLINIMVSPPGTMAAITLIDHDVFIGQ